MYRDSYAAAALESTDLAALFAAHRRAYCHQKARIVAGILGVVGFIALPVIALVTNTKPCLIYCITPPKPAPFNVAHALLASLPLMGVGYLVGFIWAYASTRRLRFSQDAITRRIMAEAQPWVAKLIGADVPSAAWILMALSLLLPLLLILSVVWLLAPREAFLLFDAFFFPLFFSALIPAFVAIVRALSFAQKPQRPPANPYAAETAMSAAKLAIVLSGLFLLISSLLTKDKLTVLSAALVIPLFYGMTVAVVGLLTLPSAYIIVVKMTASSYRLFSRAHPPTPTAIERLEQRLVAWRILPKPGDRSSENS
jgi:hypothetical protein